MLYLSIITTWICLGGHAWAQNNVTIDYVPLQLVKFKMEHPEPIGLLTTSTGVPVDIRKTVTLNTNLFTNPFATEQFLHTDKERIPERVVHARGSGAHGYFVVTHDVSKYTAAKVFNVIGKKTPVFGRFSPAIPNKGGTELNRDTKGLAVKYYTEDGNLDHLCLHHPVYFYRNPNDFPSFIRAERRNPKTNLLDSTAAWDFRTLRPDTLHAVLWLFSDYGIPYGYRRMDIFPIHTYELYNKHGERFYARFNYRTEQGLANLTTAESRAISSRDPDYYTRDLYNAIANKDYPSWRLEMDIMSFKDLKKLKYNPFDVTKLWENGTYETVTIGRLVFDKNVDNFFSEVEQSAFNPANLVPGISGPMDFMFTARLVAYRDTQDYRLGVNHNKIDINLPKYAKYYLRDGNAPVRHNMKDAPNYLPNSFNGPLPYIDKIAPSERLLIVDSNAVDLGNAADFYHHVLKTEEERIRLAQNIAANLASVREPIKTRVIEMMSLINPTLGHRVAATIPPTPEKPLVATRETYAPLARCIEAFSP
ncbi:vegetative catalase-like [Amyelois transitella]|uniref:vegetative catalase-like n=1 Tax=Amyelois transitella TaxID=680683 RepID=UPI00067D772B|nr:vegetative catalase-like [Amyelois transitella]